MINFYAPFEKGGAYCFAHVGRYPLTLWNWLLKNALPKKLQTW